MIKIRPRKYHVTLTQDEYHQLSFSGISYEFFLKCDTAMYASISHKWDSQIPIPASSFRKLLN